MCFAAFCLCSVEPMHMDLGPRLAIPCLVPLCKNLPAKEILTNQKLSSYMAFGNPVQIERIDRSIPNL